MQRAPQERRIYHVTTATSQRRSLFQVTATADLMLKTLFDYRDAEKYDLFAFVIMPDHLHLLLRPAPDVSLEKVMQLIKGGFSFRLKSKFDVWNRGFNETQVMDQKAFVKTKAYIEQNPVRRGLVNLPEDFPYSSARKTEPLASMPAHLQS
jgi:putative transposase